jgi:hypothetical protein
MLFLLGQSEAMKKYPKERGYSIVQFKERIDIIPRKRRNGSQTTADI